MGKSLAYKILEAHLIEGEMTPGKEIGIKIDQTLTQDATGTMAYLQFEAMGVKRVKTELSVSYVDHNMLQTSFENADDHRFLQSIAEKYGIYFSRPGNGICHQVHRERFGIPGKTLLGSDSHTPTAGGLGMLAIGAGGLDVAVAMAGQPYFMPMPYIVRVELKGNLKPWVTGKDIIFELLRRLTAKGGTNKIFEYGGEGVKNITCDQRFTICNMGAELGATSSIFPSDEQTKFFLKAQKRDNDWIPLSADDDAKYDEWIEINLDELEPLIAQPGNPDKVVKVKDVAGIEVSQVNIGSCTNSSYEDLAISALMLRNKTVNPKVSLTITPGSKQVFEMIARDGYLKDLISAGARILESACGPCIGMGQAPPWGAVSLRSFNRNFSGRSGTANDRVYLASPQVCIASAITGKITDPRDLFDSPIQIKQPDSFVINDNMIVKPPEDGSNVEIIRGPNIKPLPEFDPMPDKISGKVLLKVGDNISTDHILPAGSKVLPLRSNIPAISEYVFHNIDPQFPAKAKEMGGGIVIGGENYGQGSSREHAALAPRYLGLKAVIVKSYARIHWANLINFGILPLVFKNPEDYDKIEQNDELLIENIIDSLENNKPIFVQNLTKNISLETSYKLSQRQKEVLIAGGLLNYIKNKAN